MRMFGMSVLRRRDGSQKHSVLVMPHLRLIVLALKKDKQIRYFLGRIMQF